MQPGFKDKFLTALLRVLPQHALSSAMHRITRITWKPLKNLMIQEVVSRYAVDMFEAENPHPASYPSFNAFFTRALKAGARPVDSEFYAITSPADGKVNQAGRIEHGRLLQAKGHDFTLLQLLGGNTELARRFDGGSYATVYLSPRDYHRVHMPFTGKLREMIFVPGTLLSVSEATTHLVPGLFARNERLICLFETMNGPMAVILVGAIFVGSMETVWAGEVRAPGSAPTRWFYSGEQQIILKKGEEMGRFNMGSTVITLFAHDRAQWDQALATGVQVRMGQRIGKVRLAAAENSEPDRGFPRRA